MRPELPALPGLISAAEVAATAASVAALQEPDGALPWAQGQHTDVWNHVEAAMALLVGGEVEAAHRAYDWCLETQRPDGSWPMTFLGGRVDDPVAETNMSAYLAVGVWHHWLVRRDESFVRRTWPAVRAALDFVVGLQVPFGGIAWARDAEGRVDDSALLAGSSSIYQALRAGLAIAALLEEPQPDWALACGRLGHALRRHRDLFLDKSAYSMDWYYPVLGGAVRGPDARALLASRWHDFVVPGLGIRCVDTNPWVTGAETCELALALDAVGDQDRARTLVHEMQHLRGEDGSYWTGYVYPDQAIWPEEHTTYTSAAVLLAVDALSRTTPGSDIFRGSTLPDDVPVTGLQCGCVRSGARGQVS
ncbi:prenyltransferase [Nocardioides mesophilus]|uniref:Prenyltransferase n=1 Tax=Nocardioides mesophilus TaxID=433659 RepID=A0A7G9RBE1_9ACTN|nr:prenyltransferase [Nocardioides mesophilus]QNN52916.1 prenyltransferase [Nocardioides mesophilus]